MLLPSPDVLPAPSPLTFYEPVRNRRHIILNQAFLSAGPGTVSLSPPTVNPFGGRVNQPRGEPTSQGEGKVGPLLVLVPGTSPLGAGQVMSRAPPPQTPLPRGAVGAAVNLSMDRLRTQGSEGSGVSPVQGSFGPNHEAISPLEALALEDPSDEGISGVLSSSEIGNLLSEVWA